MRAELVRRTRRRGYVTRAEALTFYPEHVLDDALADGVLVRIFPGVYTVPDLAGDIGIRRRAALAFQPSGALSHLDALDVWGLLPVTQASDEPIHVTTSRSVSHSDWPHLVHHRRLHFSADGPLAVRRAGLMVVRLEQAVVESWPLLPAIDRRVPAIVAVRKRRTTGRRLLDVLAANPANVPGAADMRALFRLVAQGCHSPLEIWGHEHVFSHPGLPPSRCQVPVDLPTGRVYLDRYYEEEMLAVELDGAAYHGEPGQRERDIRRDAAVAVLGIQTIRFSHPRLFGGPDDVRAETLEILRMRRRQLGLRTA